MKQEPRPAREGISGLQAGEDVNAGSLSPLEERLEQALRELAGIGARPGGGFDRFAWTDEDRRMRRWFGEQAAARGMAAETDRNGNQWAWWGNPGPRSASRSPYGGGAVVTGSHLDSVPGGGGYDGVLGVISAFLAVDEMRRQGMRPSRPVAVACFADEEGARFGVACAGSRLMCGTLDPGDARAFTDAGGVTLADAMRRFGTDPGAIGADDERVAGIGAFVELHVEQGRALGRLGAPVGVATGIWPHGRWRLRFRGEGNHAGTTRLEDRHDPVLPFAAAVLAAHDAAARAGAHATVGRAEVHPGGANVIASRVDAWLDVRAAGDAAVGQVVAEVAEAARREGDAHGVTVSLDEQSRSPAVAFDGALRDRITRILGGVPLLGGGPGLRGGPGPGGGSGLGGGPGLRGGPGLDDVPYPGRVPHLATGAGHDAGVLAARVPAAMLFVRNPTGVSHSPAEYAGAADCAAGVRALTAVLGDLACAP